MASAQMHVGVQGIGTSKMELQFLTRHGVTHMDAQVDGNDRERDEVDIYAYVRAGRRQRYDTERDEVDTYTHM